MSAGKSVTVYGMGYVGTVSAACLASFGHNVTGVELNERKVELINSGQTPFAEPSLQALVSSGVASGHLKATTRIGADELGSIVFVCVGTPSTLSGEPNLKAIYSVMNEVKSLSPSFRPVIAIRSTVPPGTAETCQQMVGDLATVCSNPEFMREGHAVDDFLEPPYVLVGCQDSEASRALLELYEHVEAEQVCTQIRDAEAIKYVNNSWHAVKVAFANEIGAIAKAWQADTETVMDLFCRDYRLNLSAAYLRPGAPFGGSCLPKDLRALAYASTRHGIHTPLLGSVMVANDAHLIRCLELVKQQEARRVAWLGLTFKDNTDDLRESPALKLFEELISGGEEVFAYDPLLSPNHLLGANLKVYEELNRTYGQRLCADLSTCLETADLAVLYTRDSAVTEHVLALPESVTVVDLVNEGPRSKRRNYFGVCWS